MRRFDCARSFRAAAGQSVDPRDWSDARRQRPLIKQLLSPFPSFRSFICIGHFMIQAAADQAFLLIVISVCLGALFVWAFWDIEQARRFRRHHREFVRDARRSMTSGQ
jgi:hypothetical protein